MSLFESHGQPSRFPFPREHFLPTNPEVSLSSTVSDFLISLLLSPRVLWCSLSFPWASFFCPFLKKNISSAKVLRTRTSQKGWTLTFCKVFHLLLDLAQRRRLGSAFAVPAWWICTRLDPYRRPNRCQGAAKGVDWSLERLHSSNGTPERTLEPHTLSARPLRLSFVSPRWRPVMALFHFDESRTLPRFGQCRVAFFQKPPRGSVSTLWLNG